MSKRWMVTAAAALALFAAVSPASAGSANRAWVSGRGTDTTGCGAPTAPCRSLQYVHDNIVGAGGEIDVLDPAGYGAVTITKALSIVNDGVGTAGVQATSGDAVTINAGVADAIVLRGLDIDGLGTATNGIQFTAGQSLIVENCSIRHVTAQGINFNPNTASSLAVSNTLAADNGDAGIYLHPGVGGTGAVTAVVSHVELKNNHNNGLIVDGAQFAGEIDVTVFESVAAGNGQYGFGVGSTTGEAFTTLTLFHSVAVNNGNAGIAAQDAGAILRIAQSLVTGNAHSFAVIGSGSAIQSYGDNYIDGNGTDIGTLGSVARR